MSLSSLCIMSSLASAPSAGPPRIAAASVAPTMPLRVSDNSPSTDIDAAAAPAT